MTKIENDLLSSIQQCKAKSKRTGKRCRAPAMHNMRVCYHHGGKLGSKKACQARLVAILKTGFYSQENIAERRKISQEIKDAKKFLTQV